MKVQLVVVQGKPEGMVIPLANARYKIGRGEGCQLRPNSDLVSREHAEFTQDGDSVRVSDLGSRNGTEVNGKRLAPNQPATLKSGDLIKVGTLTFAIAIEGAPTAKPAGLMGAPGRKVSLDDVSNEEIDAWLVSDPSRPTPERPSGVYGGETITVETYKDQASKGKSIPTPRPAPPSTPVAAQPPPVAPAPPPIAPPAPPVVPTPPPAPVAVAPIPPPAPPAPAPPAYFPSPEPIAPPAAPVAATTPPPPAPAPAPTPEAPLYNPIFNFLANSPDLPEVEDETQADAEGEAPTPKDDIPDFSSLQSDDEDDASGTASPSAEDFVDESNPFYVKKTEPTPTPSSKAKPKEASAAADDILRKIMDRRRAR